MDNPAQPDHLSQRIGRIIATHRTTRRWSQETLATMMGISQRRVAKLESGDYDLRISTIARLANAFGLSMSQFMDTEPDAEGPTLRQRGALTGLTRVGWQRATAGTEGAIPVWNLQPRAGRPAGQPSPRVVAWALPPAGRHPTEPGLFLAQVRGKSMEPVVQDGQWCLFSKQFIGVPPLGTMCLVREAGENLTAWSIKKVNATELDGNERVRLQLVSLNPDFRDRWLVVDHSDDVAIEAVLREVLRLQS